jgi:predicted nucleic acid-binding protein
LKVYLDTSLVVALFTPEIFSERAEAWSMRQGGAGLAASAWVSTEMASALSAKVRGGFLTLEQRVAVAREWRLFRQGLTDLAVEDGMFRAAELWAERHELALRAGDALHLAIAAAHGCTLATLDRRMIKAAGELGVPVAEL